MKKIRICLLLFCLSLAYTSAQDSDLDTVLAAFEATKSLDSLRIQAQSITTGTGTEEGMSLDSEQTIEMDLLRGEETWNAYSISTSSISLPFGTMSFSSEMIWLDGMTYLRFSEVPQGMPMDLPTVWVDLVAFSAEQGTDAFLPTGTSPDALMGIFELPLNEEALEAISVLPADEIEGQTMAVYQVTLDAAAILESDAASLLNIGTGNMPQMGMPEGGMPQGMPTPENMPDPSSFEIDPENVQMSFAVYIGAEDGFVHRIYLVVNIGGEMNLSQTSVTDFSNFNEAIEINAPELGS